MLSLKSRLSYLSVGGLLLGFAFSLSAQTIFSQPDVRKYNLALGKTVFQDKCIKCHGDIDSGAPQLGSLQDWDKRIATPVETLISHALNGHGEMPPKGGFEQLSDREVSAAVAYVVDQGRRLIISESGEVVLDQSQFCTDPDSMTGCPGSQVDNTLLLQMLWMITGKYNEI